ARLVSAASQTLAKQRDFCKNFAFMTSHSGNRIRYYNLFYDPEKKSVGLVCCIAESLSEPFRMTKYCNLSLANFFNQLQPDDEPPPEER
ncbi:MAG: hypothetical protein RRY34_07735, partial [Victivallaceae bacterium]